MFQFGGLGALFGEDKHPKATRGDGTGTYTLQLLLWISLKASYSHIRVAVGATLESIILAH